MRTPFPRRVYESDADLFKAAWSVVVSGNPVDLLTIAREKFEESDFRAFGDDGFRAALFVLVIQQLGDKVIKAEPIHPLQHPRCQIHW